VLHSHGDDDDDDDGGKKRPHAAEAKALLQEILGVHDGQLAFHSCRSLGTRPLASLRSKWTTLCELLGEEDALRVLKHSPSVLAISTDTMLTALPTLEKVPTLPAPPYDAPRHYMQPTCLVYST
jgi:hypothetical protein